jgi:hypothetical protein
MPLKNWHIRASQHPLNITPSTQGENLRIERANSKWCNVLLSILIKKESVNDRLISEKKAAILQAERTRISDTLFDHSVTESQQNQGLKGTQ